MEELISEKAEETIRERVFPGCVVGVVKKSGERLVLPFGNFTYEEDSQEVKEDTIYDLASVTKSLATGSLACMLIDQGKLNVEDKLVDYVTEFNNSDRENVKIKHLLTYTLDGYGLASLKSKTASELFQTLFTRDFGKRPGTVFNYTNIPATLLGLVVEKVTGKPLDVLADEYFYKPLRMERTTFSPEKFPIEEIVPTEIDDRGLVRGIVHDESAYLCKKEGKIVGHAGLFSTVPDILTFLEMLLNKGELKGKRYFSEKMIEQMHTNQIAEINECTGLGWELYQSRYMSEKCTPQTFGKTGFTGTLCVCDIEKEVAYVILSNRTFPHRLSDSTLINKFRKAIGEIVLS